jgi:bifunctional non-homologous end joining protein LigD
VSKKRDAPYRSGVQASWVKVKCKDGQLLDRRLRREARRQSPAGGVALYRPLGWDRLVYAGKVRSGYTDPLAEELRERLDPLIVRRSPLTEPVAKPKATWVRPELLAEIQYGSINEGGILREAIYKGLRDDLTAAAPAPLPAPAEPSTAPPRPHIGVPRINILQLLPDAVVPSQEALNAYWTRLWKPALPHLGHRPLKLVRRVHGTTFYHKEPLPEIPPTVHQLTVEKREGGTGTRLRIDSLAGLLGLVDIGAVELHPWNAMVDDIERADRLVIDLDPGEGAAWPFVVEIALRLRDALERERLHPWPKPTGGKGIHLMAPLPRSLPHDAVRMLARNFVADLAGSEPDRYTTSSDPRLRHGRIYLDYLRNGRGNTAVGIAKPSPRDSCGAAGTAIEPADRHDGRARSNGSPSRRKNRAGLP